MPRLLLGALVCASASCYRTSDAFAHRWAKLQYLQSTFDEFEANGCEYIAEKGRECIHEAYRQRKDCGDGAAMDITEACDAVFVCPRDADAY